MSNIGRALRKIWESLCIQMSIPHRIRSRVAKQNATCTRILLSALDPVSATFSLRSNGFAASDLRILTQSGTALRYGPQIENPLAGNSICGPSRGACRTGMKIRKRAARPNAAQRKARKIMKAVLEDLGKNPDSLQDGLIDPSPLPPAPDDRKSDTELLRSVLGS